jgi:multidrug efflux pump subunit AcrB
MPRRMMPYVESPIVGVGSMMPGLSPEEMEIYFYKLTLLDVKSALDVQNMSRPAGTLTSHDREVLVRSDVRARTPEEVAAYPIASTAGRTVYLRDVAQVMNALREQRSLYRLNGKEAVEISIVQQPDASSVQVIEDVKATLAEIREDFPTLRFEVAYDNSTPRSSTP